MAGAPRSNRQRNVRHSAHRIADGPVLPADHLFGHKVYAGRQGHFLAVGFDTVLWVGYGHKGGYGHRTRSGPSL